MKSIIFPLLFYYWQRRTLHFVSRHHDISFNKYVDKGDRLNYRLLILEYPLCDFLHASGERGNDNDTQSGNGRHQSNPVIALNKNNH